jgi:uncharacterized protein (TIGR03083 family)
MSAPDGLVPPPPPLDTVLGEARRRRAPGRPVDAVEPAAPLDAFAAAAAQLRDVLVALTPEQWDAPAHPELGSVHDVIGHLAAVEELTRGWVEDAVAGRPLPAVSEHLEATAWARDAFALVPGATVAARWYDAAMALHAACAAADPATPVLVHDLPTDVDGFLVLRAFELWAHLHDVCEATGQTVPDADVPRLTLMSNRLMGVVPVALLLRGVEAPVAELRFVLTGPGGGCHDLDLAAAGEADRGGALTIVADTADLCRVAARRLPHDALDVVVEGDEEAAGRILATLDAFARD